MKLNEISNKTSARSGIPRTCREAHLADPSLTSGMHWIDPDGQAVGDDPIYVYCDMISGVKEGFNYLFKIYSKRTFTFQDRRRLYTIPKHRRMLATA
jgi:hypothetical protein